MRRFLPFFNRAAISASSRRLRRRHCDLAIDPRRLRMESLEDRRVLATFTVTNANDDGPGSLRDAIAQANANNNSPAVVDVIDFGSLFTTPQTILLTTGELSITESLTIEGSGADLLTIDASGSDLTPLVKDGQGSRVFNIDDGGFDLINVTLDGLAITGGDIGGYEDIVEGDVTLRVLFESGGGVKSVENLSVLNCVVENNAVIADLSANSLTPSYTSHNSRLEGGGIAVEGSASLTVTNSIIRNNLLRADYHGAKLSAEGGPEIHGAGISTFNTGQVIIQGSLINENIGVSDISNIRPPDLPGIRGINANLTGGGISARGDTNLAIERSVVRENSLSLIGDQINGKGTDNTMQIRGVGVFSESVGQIESTTVSNNSGIFNLDFLPGSIWLDMRSQGGGIWLNEGSVLLSSISGNAFITTIQNDANLTIFPITSWGAGIYVGGDATIRHSTIAENQLESTTDNLVIALAGAGMWSIGNALQPSEVDLDHALLANSEIVQRFRRDPNNSNDDDLITTFEDLSTRPVGAVSGAMPEEITVIHSLVETYDVLFSPSSGNNILNTDPLLGPLQNNGGFRLPDGSRILTHALLPDSPAIDAGDPTLDAGVGDTPEFDERGYPFDRVIDAPGTSQTGAIIDIGAFEYGYTADADGDGFVDGGDFLAWQRGFGTTSGATREDGDFDGDGDVDSHDLDIWKAMFGSMPSPVDEGMTMAFASDFHSETEQTVAPLDSTPPFVAAAESEPVTAIIAFEAALAGFSTKIEPTLSVRRWHGEEDRLLDDSTILHHDESPVDCFDDAFELL